MKVLFPAFLFLHSFMYSQSWVPTNAATITGRYDDISFVTPDTGWVVGSTSSNGFINHTKNGGATWTTLKTLPGVYMRSVEFANKNIGFAGALNQNGTNVFFKTTDGGVTWTDISNVITGLNKGICGICCVNANVVYAVGVYSTPAYVMKSTNGGANWTKIDMSSYASGLVDVQFTDAITGYVTGQSNVWAEGAVILKTVDGGATWTKVFKSNVSGEYVWKIQNLNGTNWYASVERATNGLNVFLKSTNGGTTWTSSPVATSSHFQGIGFLTTQLGWTGNNDLYRTSNGGSSWVTEIPYSANNGFNRFQRVNSTTAYFSSNKIYKWSSSVTGINEPDEKPEERNWLSVFPNPARETISYQLNLPNKTMYVARLFNSKNEMIWEETNQLEKGIYNLTMPPKVSPGIYYVYVMYNEGLECEKVVVE